MMQIVYCIALVTLSGVFASVDIHPLSDEFINNINSQQSLWKAGRNFDANTPLSQIKSMLGAKRIPTEGLKRVRHVKDTDIPATFDARTQWSNCTSIREIADQSACGSCWAVSTASCMSDRLCINTNGKSQLRISASNIMSCCRNCGDGCEGGVPYYAWAYWLRTGIVSGGLYNSSVGCQSYPFPSCEHHVSGGSLPACPKTDYETPACATTCDKSSSISYNDALTHGSDYYFVNSNVEQIQLEILKNGPAVADFDVYKDFLSYKSGVYRQTSGNLAGGHAVRILGWGTENNVPYWLIANSWNTDWGLNGTFKILRGQNECGIEQEVSAGSPKL